MSEEQAKAFLDSATQALQNGQFAQALEFIEQSLALKPDNTEAFVLKGIAHSQLQQPDEAKAALQRAIMLSPYNVKAYYNLAVHYYSNGEKELAQDMAREAVRIEPKHVGAKELLARIGAETKPVGTSVSTPETLAEQGAASSGLGHPESGSAQQPMEPPPGTGVMPPPGTGVMPPPGTGVQPPPSQQQGPYQAPPGQFQQPPGQPYYRPGYENKGVHSIAFIENMGKSWTTVGYAIGGVSTVFWFLELFQMINQWQQSGGDLQKWLELQQQFGGGGQGALLLQLISLFMVLISLIWMIMDISDRRGNWLWLLPFVICCCCTGAYGPLLLIYVWKGRD